MFPTKFQCFCTTEHQIGPFDLKIRPIILKFQGLCREVLAILYFLIKMQDSSFRKSKFEFSKFVYKIFEGSPGDPWGSPGIPGGPRGPRG